MKLPSFLTLTLTLTVVVTVAANRKHLRHKDRRDNFRKELRDDLFRFDRRFHVDNRFRDRDNIDRRRNTHDDRAGDFRDTDERRNGLDANTLFLVDLARNDPSVVRNQLDATDPYVLPLV